VAIYKDGQIINSKIILVGGDFITKDIASYFMAPPEHAEALKKNYGWAIAHGGDENDMIEVQRLRQRPAQKVTRSTLNFVIEARCEQIIQQVEKVIQASISLDELVGGIVLTGGTSLLNGLVEKFQKHLGVETCLGIPTGVTGFSDIVKSPMCATAVGMLQYALKERRRVEQDEGAGFPRVYQKLREFVARYF